MRFLLLTVLFLCCATITTKAQKLEFNGEFLLFREAKTKQPVLIIDDSLMYKGNAMKRIAFKHTEYPAKLQEYKFFNIGKKTYLVHEGCGPVLEYRNDSIVRIDNSFLHRNQFGAVRFVYNNEIYFYGGYGLFTFKNILTKYNFQTREWIEVRTFCETPMEKRKDAISYLINNKLYLFGGITKDEMKTQGSKLLDTKIWELDLQNMKWSLEGQINGITNLECLLNKLVNNSQEGLYFLTDAYYGIDFRKNNLKKSELIFCPKIISNYFEGNKVICVIQNELNKSFCFTIFPVNLAKGKPLETHKFIVPLTTDYKLTVILILLIFSFCVLYFFFRKKMNSNLKQFDGIIYNKQSQLFLYKNKPITIFDEQEKRLLLYLLEQDNKFVSLNNLNQLFENYNQPETISATVKRREQTVSRLLAKVSKMTGIEEEELLLEQKNSEDKRIKDLKILPNLLKKV